MPQKRSRRPTGSEERQESLDLSDSEHICLLEVKDVAIRLGIATSTLNGWLKEDEGRAQPIFAFHRWRGRQRRWSEAGFQKLEIAIHRESRAGVLSGSRIRRATAVSPPDPDAEASLDEVLGDKRTY